MKLNKMLLLIVAIGLIAGPAFAAVDGTHHDVSPTGWATQTKGTCYFCHGALDISTISGYGTIGALCVSRCHAGSEVVSARFAGNVAEVVPAIPNIVNGDNSETARANSLTAISNAAHGLTKGLMSTRTTLGAATDITSAGLPYTNDPSKLTIECTSCHNVHDNTNPPFLHSSLGGTTISFCERCHTPGVAGEGRGAEWSGGEIGPNGEHPVNFGLDLQDVTSRALGGRLGRYIQFDDGAAEDIFDIDMTDAGPTGDLNLNTVHYLTGGKVILVGGGMGEAVDGAKFGCYTCHVTHQPNTTDNLVACDTVGSTVNGDYNPLCTRCHGQAALAANDGEWNPGLSDATAGRTVFGHPLGVNSNAGVGAPDTWVYNSMGTANVAFTVNLAAINGYATAGGVGYDTVTGKIYCTSCHDVHGGDLDTMAAADLDGTIDGTAPAAVCYYCHTGVGIPDVADNDGVAGELSNVHHPTDTGDTAVDADNDALVIANPSWAGAAQANGDVFGNLADGLQCPDCHAGGYAGGTAHNW